MVGLSKYMIEKDDSQITSLLKHQTSKALSSVQKKLRNISQKQEHGKIFKILSPWLLIGRLKSWKAETTEKNWWGKDGLKTNASYVPNTAGKEYINTEQSLQWMKYSGLKG